MLAAGGVLLLIGMAFGVGLWLDQRAIAGARRCEPPVTPGDRSCVYELPGFVRDASNSEFGQDLTVELTTIGQTHRGIVRGLQRPLTTGTRVTARLWDGRMISVEREDERGRTQWHLWPMLITLVAGWTGLALLAAVRAGGAALMVCFFAAPCSLPLMDAGLWVWVIGLAAVAVATSLYLGIEKRTMISRRRAAASACGDRNCPARGRQSIR